MNLLKPTLVLTPRSEFVMQSMTYDLCAQAWRLNSPRTTTPQVGVMPFGACGDNTESEIQRFLARVGLCAVVAIASHFALARPGGPGAVTPRGSHKPVRARISASYVVEHII